MAKAWEFVRRDGRAVTLRVLDTSAHMVESNLDEEGPGPAAKVVLRMGCPLIPMHHACELLADTRMTLKKSGWRAGLSTPIISAASSRNSLIFPRLNAGNGSVRHKSSASSCSNLFPSSFTAGKNTGIWSIFHEMPRGEPRIVF